MSKNIYLSLTGILLCIIVKAQTSKTITLNYEFQNFPTTCNTFATAQKVSGTEFEHKTSFGAPGFINLNGRKTLSMTAQNVSSSSYRATQYFITYPFKAGNRYKIRIYGKYNYTNTTLLSPRIGIRLSNDANEKNTSAACIGPVQKNAGLHLNFSNALFGPNWGWSSYIYDGLLATDQNYLQILCTPGLDPNSYTNLETAYVGAVQIIEESPAPPVIYPPTSGFEGKFYRNTTNQKIFVGLRGKYRPIFSPNFFNFSTINFIDVTADPDASLVDGFFPETLMLPTPYGWDDPVYIDPCYLFESSTGKWYLAEIGPYPGDLITNNNWQAPLQLNLTELTNTALSQYHLKSVNVTTKGYVYFNGSGILGVNVINVNTIINGNTILLSEFVDSPYINYIHNKTLYFNKLPNL